ncbi:MAG TPA: hypothetical protein PLX50_10400 [Candidatus Aminicenantes bacterium]|nr:hypothetical protein [Candidatus Aminicenantes bacterium]
MNEDRIFRAKTAAVIAVSLFIVFFCPSPSPANPPKFSFKLGAGGDYLSGGDLNAGMRGMSAFQLDNGADKNGLFKELHLGAGSGIEILMEISPRLEVAFGVSYLYAARESSTSYIWNSVTFRETVRPRLEVVPVTLGFSYKLAQSSGFDLYLDAGAGLYKSRMAWKFDLERAFDSFPSRQNGEWKASKNALGFQGGLRLEKSVSPFAAVYIEAFGRCARFRDIRGKYKVRIFQGADYREEQGRSTLWAAEYRAGDESYPWIVFSDSKPTALYYADTNEARVDVSGVSLRTGIRVRF